MRRHFIGGFLATVFFAALAPIGVHDACAQDKEYPLKPIRLVIPWAYGGSSDLVGRTIGQYVSKVLGQPVLVDSKPGAGGTVGSTFVAHSEPDGYTIELATNSFAIAPNFYTSLPFDTIKDFTPIAYLGESPLFLVVHPSVGVSTLQELIALARAKPGALNYGSSGNGTSLQIAGEFFKQLSKTDIRHVPYKGNGPAATDLVAGNIQMMFSDLSILPHIKSGRVKTLAVAMNRRAAVMPDMPTVEEAGLPGFSAVIWSGIVGPKGIPPHIVTKLNHAFNLALKDTDTIERLAAVLAFEPRSGSADEFGRMLREYVRSYSEIIKNVGMKAE